MLMSAELNDMIAIMRDQLIGNGGIITVHDTCTSEVVTGLEKVSAIITDTEDELAEAFDFLRASFTYNSVKNGEIWNVLDVNSDIALSSIQSNVKDITNTL